MQGITDCTGKTINLGDFVETADGRIIQVEGAAVLKATMFNAATCKVVPKPHGHKPGAKVAGPMSDSLANGGVVHGTKAAADDTDCVVWGS